MNRSKLDRKRIALSRETVRHLNGEALRGVAGGMTNQSRLTQCECPTALGCPSGTTTFTVSRVNTACTQP